MMATFTQRGVDEQGKEIWYVRIFVDGKQKGFTFHGSRKQAEKEAAKLEIAKERGETITPSKMKVKEYLKEWMETYQKPEVTKITYHKDKLKLDAYIYPIIENKSMKALTAMDCQKVINALAVDQGKVRTAVTVFNLLKKAFRKAVDLGYLIKNPMDSVTKPKDRAQQRPFLTIEQASIFMEYAKKDNYYPLFAFLLLTGVRPEEAYGLQWADVDFDKATIAIVRSAKSIPGGGWEFADLKTRTSRRNLDLSPSLAEILRNHKREQAKVRLIMGAEWNDNDLVFANMKGNPMGASRVRDHLAKVLADADLPKIRLYDLRHTHGSMLMSEGAAIKEISDRLGHANTSMTVNRYLHATPSRTRASVNRLDVALEEAAKKREEKQNEQDVN